jgi:hypothetical protein
MSKWITIAVVAGAASTLGACSDEAAKGGGLELDIDAQEIEEAAQEAAAAIDPDNADQALEDLEAEIGADG